MGRKSEGDQAGLRERRRAEKLVAQMATADLLDAGRLAEAVALVCAYEARQERPRGVGVNWSSGTEGLSRVMTIYEDRPPFLRNVDSEGLADVRLIAAMDELWGEKVGIFPARARALARCRFALGDAARQLQFYAAHQEFLAQARALGGSFHIEYLAASGDCPACMARHERLFAIGDAPALPTEDCTCESGCRCSFGIRIDDGIDDESS